MALNKAIEHGKEKRKPYRGAKAFVCSCRNHGTCEWCRENRMYKTIRDLARTRQEMKESE
jgi:hypothetical protein